MIDKFQASMLGFAIGDALAAPLEDFYRFDSQGQGPITYYTKALPSHPINHLKPGQYSDETQTMLLLAQSLVDKNGFSLDDLLTRFVDWYHSQRKRSEWRFPSNTLIKSCKKLATGVSYSQAGHLSAGINASCRTLSYALAYYKSPSLLKNAIEKSCRITHTDHRVIGVSLAFAAVIEMGLDGAELSNEAIFSRIIERSQPFASEMPKKMKLIKDCLGLEPKAAILNIGNSGFCLDAFAAAVYWFLKFNGSFDNTIIGAANAGGDSDAIAAMAGAMFGAFHGLASIQPKWLKELENAQEIRRLGCEIYRIASAKQG